MSSCPLRWGYPPPVAKTPRLPLIPLVLRLSGQLSFMSGVFPTIENEFSVARAPPNVRKSSQASFRTNRESITLWRRNYSCMI